MSEEIRKLAREAKRDRARPLVSAVLPGGGLVEMLHRVEERRTLFCVFEDGAWREESDLPLNGERVVPYSPGNNLLRHDVVLFPSGPEEYGSEDRLLAEIQAFLHRYVDLSSLFERLATYYVLLSWVYDRFNELPYLRVRGDPGSGKTRFLQTVGSLCYKPIFASGASTVSPLFRILDAFQGSLVLDESDFRLSDERAEIVKILNNGNARGFPVLRSELVDKREFDPRAYAVFGPKLIATRGFFEDRALESRCLTEEMGRSSLRTDIPITLPESAKDEALALRNKLLLFRFRSHGRVAAIPERVDPSIEPRLNQVFLPLLSVITDPRARAEVTDLARRMNREAITERGLDTEAQLLEVIRDSWAEGTGPGVAIKDVTRWFADRFGEDYTRKVTPKWIGGVIRKKLRLKTQKSNGNFVIPLTEVPALRRLYERYGIEARGDTRSEPVPAADGTSP